MGGAIGQTLSLLAVGAMWGCTNPLLKIGSVGLEKASSPGDGPIQKFIKELVFMFTNWKYLVPFLMNMSGSLLFYFLLSSVDISLVVPICNGLTFVFTTITSILLGQKIEGPGVVIGLLFSLAGITACVYSKEFS
mmetsp:Transcript_13940/g.35621  ORF Transcript_13940/g.35621 Transcript_13940/m.35621 type:complete len:135 (-) Transcript_13940:491-895(-)